MNSNYLMSELSNSKRKARRRQRAYYDSNQSKNQEPNHVPKGQFFRNPVSGRSCSIDFDVHLMMNGLRNMSLGRTFYDEAQTFERMNLSVDVLKGIHDMGYEKPALCQKKIILPLINGKDIVCQAQSGMGKTAAYVIGILQKINLYQTDVQVLILTPTRELAEQVAEVFYSLGKHMNGLRIQTCIGGTNRKNASLRLYYNKPQIIIGTCGRIADHFRHQQIDPLRIQTLVIDEADKMIGDFRKDLRYLISSISGDAQIVLASATMPQRILHKSQKEILRNPILVLIPNEELTLQGIRQYYVKIETSEQKIDTLADIFPSLWRKKGIIFCNTRTSAQDLNKKLQAALCTIGFGNGVDEMVGTMDQGSRNSALKGFRSGNVNYLVSSDLLGRGIDVQQVQVVINFDLPSKKEEYIHRVGRAGRFGRKGVAVTFVLSKPSEERKLAELQQFYRTRIEELPSRIGDVFNN